MKGTGNNHCYDLLLINICCYLPTFSPPPPIVPRPTFLSSFSTLKAVFKEFLPHYSLYSVGETLPAKGNSLFLYTCFYETNQQSKLSNASKYSLGFPSVSNPTIILQLLVLSFEFCNCWVYIMVKQVVYYVGVLQNGKREEQISKRLWRLNKNPCCSEFK